MTSEWYVEYMATCPSAIDDYERFDTALYLLRTFERLSLVTVRPSFGGTPRGVVSLHIDDTLYNEYVHTFLNRFIRG